MGCNLKNLFATSVFLGIFVLAGTAFSATYQVPEQYPTIQAALDSVPIFSRISVRDGTYYENLTWPQKSFIVLESRSGNPSRCIIDGGRERVPVIQLSTSKTLFMTIADITIRRGSPLIFDGSAAGAGISINNTGLYSGSVFLTLRNSVLRENYGPALILFSQNDRANSLLMNNCLIIENADDSGSLFGSVSVVGNLWGFDNQITLNDSSGVAVLSRLTSASFTFERNEVMFNGSRVAHAYGAVVLGKYTVNIRDNSIVANNSPIESSEGLIVGAELFVLDSPISGSVIGNEISGHYGASAAGINIFDVETLLIEGNDIADNRGHTYYGCGVWIGNYDNTIDGTAILRNNMIYENYPTGVYVSNSIQGETFIINNTIVNNHEYGIVADPINQTPPTIANCIVGHWDLETASDDLYGVAATYSDIQDGDPGEGNFSEAPLFLDSKAGNFHIESPSKGPGSPCIGRGNALVPYMPEGDYDFQVRHNPPDIGADEAIY